MALDEAAPILLAQIKRFGGERAITARLCRLRALAVAMIVADRVELCRHRAFAACIAQDQRVIAQMLKQGRKLFLDQRQPMVHPGEPLLFEIA